MEFMEIYELFSESGPQSGHVSFYWIRIRKQMRLNHVLPCFFYKKPNGNVVYGVYVYNIFARVLHFFAGCDSLMCQAYLKVAPTQHIRFKN